MIIVTKLHRVVGAGARAGPMATGTSGSPTELHPFS